MRLPLIFLLIGCVGLGACGGLDVAEPESRPAAADKKSATFQTPWKLSIASQRNAGTKIQSDDAAGTGDTETLEAAGSWLVVMVTVENTSTQKQSAKDVFSTSSAKLVDATGAEHDADSDAVSVYAQEESVLDKKPFTPGEKRSLKFVFDLPKGAKPKHLTLLGDDAKGEVQDFIVKF